MKTSARHEFTTTAFAPAPDEDDATSHRVYGRALATWLAGQLRAQGERVEEMIAKKFGWCLLLRREPYPLWIACSNRAGAADQWVVYAIAETNFLQESFGRAEVDASLAALALRLARIIPTVPGLSAHDVV